MRSWTRSTSRSTRGKSPRGGLSAPRTTPSAKFVRRQSSPMALVGTLEYCIYQTSPGHKCFYCQLRSCARCGGRAQSKNKVSPLTCLSLDSQFFRQYGRVPCARRDNKSWPRRANGSSRRCRLSRAVPACEFCSFSGIL